MWLIAVDNPIYFAAALVACWDSGVIPVISAELEPTVLKELEGEISGAIVDQSLFSELPEISISARTVPQVTSKFDYSRFQFPNSMTAGYLFTSGSSGKRKKISKSIGSLFKEVDVLEEMFGEKRREKDVYSTVSSFHIYGLLFSVIWPLRYGHKMSAPQNLHWEEILGETNTSSEDGALFISSPAHLRILPHFLSTSSISLQKCMIFCSGGALERDVAIHIYDATEVTPIEIFGSTETGGVAYREQQKANDTPFTPLKSVKIKIDTENHLRVKSPWIEDDWLETGDIAETDTKGDFFLQGRFDRIEKIGGKRISLTKIEKHIATHHAVIDVRIIPFEESRTVTRTSLAALIIVATELTESERKQFVSELKKDLVLHLPKIATPRKWRFLKEFPLTSQGKVSMKSLLELL